MGHLYFAALHHGIRKKLSIATLFCHAINFCGMHAFTSWPGYLKGLLSALSLSASQIGLADSRTNFFRTLLVLTSRNKVTFT